MPFIDSKGAGWGHLAGAPWAGGTRGDTRWHQVIPPTCPPNLDPAAPPQCHVGGLQLCGGDRRFQCQGVVVTVPGVFLGLALRGGTRLG